MIKLKELLNEDVSPKGWNMSKKYIKFIEREVKNLKKYHMQQNEEDFLEVANYIELQLKQMKKDLNESVKEEKQPVNERITKPFLVHPTDPDQTERHWVKVFKELAKGHGAVTHYGPRESDMYDWNDRSNYRDAITEYNKYMNKVADNLNKSLDDMNNIYKVWDKISKKYRKKDGGR